MPVAFPIDSLDALSVRAWPDPVIDAVGHHPCSRYVETYWLGLLGPSTTFLLRHLVTELEASPDGFALDLETAAHQLGLGGRYGRQSPFVRSLQRLVRFHLAQVEDATTYAVRLRVPPLTRSQQLRLPPRLQAEHRSWQEHQLGIPAVEQQRRRARQLALSYLEAGLSLEETERQLMRLDYHPAVCHDGARWAGERHRLALVAAAETGG